MARDILAARKEPAPPPNTFSYFVREAFRRIWISKRTSFVAIAMIMMSLLILGAFLLVAENLNRVVHQWEGRSHVTIYLQTDATADQVRLIDIYLDSHPELARRQFISREKAMERFKSYFTNLSEVVGQLDENPFPASFECEVVPQSIQSASFDREMAELRAMPQVEQVQFDWEWVNRLKRLVNAINIVGAVAGGILAIAAAFTIANVIRLTMLLYREEIEIMRLVGATEQIIRGPFLIEGLMQGTLGGLLAVGVLFGLYHFAGRLITPSGSLFWSFLFTGFLPWQKVVALVLGGTLAGYLGSWLSVRDRGTEPGRP